MLPALKIVPATGKGLVGVARMAADSSQISLGHGVEYRSLSVRSLLSRCDSPRVPFAWTINPYRGCEFACKYCYARYTHEFMELRDGIEFERHIFIKENAAGQLRQDLKRVKPGQMIAIGTATDPYQPAERNFEVTRSILEALALHRGLFLGLITKSQLVVRDIDLLRKIAEGNFLAIHVTVTTMDAALARKLEPRAPRPDLRMDAVRQLREAGLITGVLCAPVLPGLTDSLRNLENVVRAASQARASYITANPLFLKPCSAKIFLPFLREHFPALVKDYEQRFRSNAFVGGAYRKRLSMLMARICQKHGMPGSAGRARIHQEGRNLAMTHDPQMTLF